MPSDFTVVAIVAAYNEADIIEQCIVDLIAQGLQVYVIDDGSTDGTATLVEQFLGRGVLAVERRSRPASDGVDAFDWEGILARKAQLASELDADWFLHHDADEFREGPWFGLSLKASIQLVDASGYNAIDSACLNFRPVAERFERGVDVRQAFRYYEPAALHDRIQIRCWKRGERLVDLVSSGGHEAEFAGRKVFPIRFLLRHYPIRSQEHGERKVFVERRPRFRARERERGWHVQYRRRR